MHHRLVDSIPCNMLLSNNLSSSVASTVTGGCTTGHVRARKGTST